LMQQNTAQSKGEGLQYVLKSLNVNQRELVQMLAKVLVKDKFPDVDYCNNVGTNICLIVLKMCLKSDSF
jgi:hypothetical protein